MTDSTTHEPPLTTLLAARAGRAFAPLGPSDVQRMGRSRIASRHMIHERYDWSDATLAAMLDAYPRERLGVFRTGENPCDPRSWVRGVAGDLPGQELIARIHEGRLWLNLREANRYLPQIGAVEGDIVADLARDCPRLKTFRRDLGLLISSPRAQVLYHFDVAMVALFHLRGRKTFYLYPTDAPFVTPLMVESAVLRETSEMLVLEPSWDDSAEVRRLKPGDWVAWAQNAPHRIVNGEDLNVSISMEYLTPRAALRANQIYTNAVLRRTFGWTPGVGDEFTFGNLAKAAAARLIKTLKPVPASEPWTARFNLAEEPKVSRAS